MRSFVKISIALISIMLLPSICATQATGDIVTVTLDAADYQITEDEDGFQMITMKDFGSLSQPGEPWLPGKIFYVALPPLAKVNSVTVDGVAPRELPGTYNIAPMPPMLPWTKPNPDEVHHIMANWEQRRRESYASEAPYPEEVGQFEGTGGLRKYTFARISFCPFVYYPKSGQLIHYQRASVSINYTAPGMTDEVVRLLSDRNMEERAAKLLVNYPEASSWYPRMAPEGKVDDWDYVIIATDSMSASCDTLKDWKQDLGYDVKVVTTTWINANYAGADIQARIRNFLQDKYLDSEWGIEYVLIAGDYNHIPMRVCYPFAADHSTDTPTDYYYADLTGDWDSDGDGFPGENGQDNVDWVAEVYVGRILSNDANATHNICKKMVKFEKEDASSWKYDALLIGAVGWFANEDTSGGPKMDCAELMEDMKTDMLASNWDYTTMYEKAGLDTCPYLCDMDLTAANVKSDWSTGTYGVVNWWGHGSEDCAWRKWWETDDGDSIPESDDNEIEWEKFIQNSDAPSLDDNHPSIVYANSCLCGKPETNCLAQTLLSQGASGVIAATRVSWGPSTWDDPTDGGIGSMDYYFFDELLNHDKKLGEALFDAKVTYHTQHGLWSSDWMNLFDFCLYGDPSMIWQGAIPAADTISDDTTWTVSQSPYIIENKLYIRGTDGPDNVTTLTINPGVRVVFGEDAGLIVGSASSAQPGALVADGKPDSVIIFTSASDTTKNEPWDWDTIEFQDYSKDNTCLLDHCLIEYPNHGITCNGASPTISNCLLRNGRGHGIALYSNSDPQVDNTLIHDFQLNGIRLSGGSDPTLYGDSVSACLYGLFVEASSPAVDSCFFVNNDNDGIVITGPTSGPTITNGVTRDNGSAGINAYNWSVPVISGCQISNNAIWGITLSGVDGAQVYGNTITFHDSIAGIEIQGANDSVRVYSNIITDNSTGLFLNFSTSSSPTVIYYNTIEDNDYGVSIEDTASISIHHNDILNNITRNLNYGPIDTLVAEYNWWGSTSTVAIENKLGGYGEIDYHPFLTNTFHAPWVEVVTPNGGEVFSDTSNITWVAPDVDGDSVEIDILYSANGGINWWVVAAHEENDSIYAWDTTPRDDGNQYMIKLQAYDGTYTSWDTSDAVFTIYNPDPPQLMLVHPDGGEILVDSTTIWWWAIDPDVGDSATLDVDIDYSADAGTTWTVIDSNLVNDCFHGWHVSQLEDGDQYMVRVIVTDTTGLSARDSSSAVFEINNPDPPTVTVLSPNGGEHWSGTHDIVWTASDPDSVAGLTFDLYVGIATASDTSWTQLLNNSSDTSYTWYTHVYSDWGAYYAKVVVEDPDALTDQDLSNHSFTVDNTPPPMPSYLYLDAEWDPISGLGTVYLTWEDVVDTLSPPEFFSIFYGTSNDNIDYNTPIYSGSSNFLTVDSLSTGPHYFGLKARDSADQPNWVTYQKSKGTNGEGVYFTTGADVNLSNVVSNSNGVVTGSSPNFSLDGTVVLTYSNFMIINYENLIAGDSDGHHALRVYGRLVAHKSTFTASSAGDWRGIVFADSSMDYDTTTTVGCEMDSCTIRHAVNGIDCNWSSPMLNGNEISHCSFAGINCFWSGAIIQNSDANVGGIHHNANGIWEDGEGPTGAGILVRDNEVRDNDVGMHFGNIAQPIIMRNLIHDNFIGAEFQTGAFPVQFNLNDIYNNLAYGVENDTGSVLVTAENNWWGAASGPSGQGSGSGDTVSSNVDFQPFLTFPTGTDVANWCQLISPDSITMDVGDTTQTILGQVYEPGITPGGGQGAGIIAQVGYGSNNTEPSGAGWNWSTASYVRDVGNNDEYGGTVAVSRAGSYDYAFRFSKDDSITWVYGDLDGNNQGAEGTNGYTTDQAGDLTVGYVLNPVIVIDDDLGSWQNNYHDALSNNGINFDTWDVSAQGSPPAGLLNKYQAVVWETGEDATATITDDDENALMTYLDNGGHLFLSSKGYLTEAGAPRPFITDYLHVDMWINDVTGIEREWGEPGDIIADGLDLQLDWPLCVGTDDMIPGNDAVGIFHNDYSKSGKQMNFGGLRYPIAAVKSNYRLVFFSFPFEAIANDPDPNNQNTVMDRVMTWLITDNMPPEALMAGSKCPCYVPLTWSPPGSHVDTLQIHDGTFEGGIRASDADNVLAVSLTPEEYPCVLRTLMFQVWDVQPMTAVDMYVFADTSSPGAPIAGPYEVITLGHGDGWVFVDIWDEQVTIDSGDVYIGVAYRDSIDTGVGADRTPPFHDKGWWAETPDGPWTLLSNFGWPFNVSNPSITAVVSYQDSSSKLLGSPTGVALTQFGSAAIDEGSKAFLGYNVYRSKTEGGPYDFMEFVPKDQTTYQDSSVTGGVQFWYVVSSTYNQEETGYSNEDDGTPRSILPPMAVDDLEIALEVDDLHLSWTAVSLDIAGHSKTTNHYIIYRVTDPGVAIGDLDSVGMSYDEEYVDPSSSGNTGVQYFYVVKAVDCDGSKSSESNRVGEFDRTLTSGSK
jgi:parallel beta-helix repeat protein